MVLKNNAGLTAAERVALARMPQRPGVEEYVDALFENVFEQRGDRAASDDQAIMCAIATFHGRPVTVVGHRKGSTIEQRMAFNFGMPSPEGYRKAQRSMRAAEKFGRPIITFIDTPGAYPGLEAEEHGQGEAIARSIELMSALICVICGEGGSGGALALAVGNRVFMLENSVYSVLSPEGFASILWKDASRSEEACEVMKLTAQDLLDLQVIDAIVPEPAGGAHEDPQTVFQTVDSYLRRALDEMQGMTGTSLARERYTKFRSMGMHAQRRCR